MNILIGIGVLILIGVGVLFLGFAAMLKVAHKESLKRNEP